MRAASENFELKKFNLSVVNRRRFVFRAFAGLVSAFLTFYPIKKSGTHHAAKPFANVLIRVVIVLFPELADGFGFREVPALTVGKCEYFFLVGRHGCNIEKRQSLNCIKILYFG